MRTKALIYDMCKEDIQLSILPNEMQMFSQFLIFVPLFFEFQSLQRYACKRKADVAACMHIYCNISGSNSRSAHYGPGQNVSSTFACIYLNEDNRSAIETCIYLCTNLY